jgi:hypothetical protein
MTTKRTTQAASVNPSIGTDSNNTISNFVIFLNSFYIIKYKTFKVNYLLQSVAKIVKHRYVLKKVIQKAIIINKTYRKY